MKIENEFSVGVPLERAWELLTDLEGIAPCLPGAQLTDTDGDTFHGKMKIKVGPVTAEYLGTARFSEKDDELHRAVIDAKGRDSRGAGNAAATISAEMRSDGDNTIVSISTDLKVSGKVAQFGRGIMTDVSQKLLGEFVDCLEAKLTEPEEAAEDSSADSAAGGVGAMPRVEQEVEALDLMEYAGPAVSKRLIPPLVGGIVIVAIIWYWLRR
ncbi:MAG: SRPBCC family protein [Acidimicrobiales bacterium]